MKTLIIFSIIFLSFQETKTEWVTIGQQPRVSNDTAQWIYGRILPMNDSISIQYRKSITGIIQRREIKK